MFNLLEANLMRLRRSLIYKLCLIFTFGLSVYSVVFLGNVVSPYTGETFPLERSCYDVGPFLTLIIPVFTGLFIGSEYAGGAIRNKLIVGCSKAKVFMSEFLCVSIADFGLVVVWFIGSFAGIPRFGLWRQGVGMMLIYFLISSLSAVALSAIFTIVGMMCSGRASGSVAAIIIGLGMLLSGSALYNVLLEPETVQSATVTVDGQIVMAEPTPNPRYIAEPWRTVGKVTLNALPCGQEILIANSYAADEEGLMDMRVMAISLAAEILVIPAAGVAVFRRKDVR